MWSCGMNDARTVFELLKEKRLTLSFAESCTGGLLSKEITEVPGASQVYCGGVCTYWTETKHRLLGVPQEILAEYGPVSRETAMAMAEGCRNLFGSDFALSVTGSAGPDPDERNTPVGTVFLGVASPRGSFARGYDFSHLPSRHAIREAAAAAAFSLLGEQIALVGKDPL